MMTSIDILVPVYNRPDFLPELIDSCLAQTFPANQIILVDDASPDNRVGLVLAEYASKFPKVRVLTREVNGGICAAQETGLKSSSADFIAFVDCDDYLSPVALELSARTITTEIDYVFSDRIEFDEHGNMNLVRYGGQPRLIGKGDVRDHLLDHMVASHLKVVRRSKINEVGGFSSSLDGVQDWDIALKISESGNFSYVPEGIYFHRIHPSQVTRTQSARMIKDTNSVRRSAFIRRNVALQARTRSFPDLSDGYQLSRILQLLRSGVEFGAALGISQTGKPMFIPMLTNGQLDETTVSSVAFLLIHHEVAFEANDLKPFLLSPNPATIGFVTSMNIAPQATNRFRWLNSYFDYVLALDNLGEIAISGYTHEELKLLNSAALRARI
jgi:glycosyltransferase involved in cell wall biosynthesis